MLYFFSHSGDADHMGDDASHYNRYDFSITSLNDAFMWQEYSSEET